MISLISLAAEHESSRELEQADPGEFQTSEKKFGHFSFRLKSATTFLFFEVMS